MKKTFLFLFFLLLIPLSAYAHGGVSQIAGNNIVFLNQSPLSPLVGENVQMSFSIKNKNFEPLKNLPVQLTLTDTYYGDASKDKVVLTKNAATDNNGDFEFDYTFQKENYFDLDLDFKDPNSQEKLNTGFLIQPRLATQKNEKAQLITYAIVGLAAFCLGLILKMPKTKKT